MFTGIIQEVGVVEVVRELDGGRELRIRAPRLAGDLAPGASVAVDGACLTAVETDGETFLTQVIATTLSRTIAGSYTTGSKVNLETSLRLGHGLDGHLVQGHVDGLATLRSVEPGGETRILEVSIPEEVGRLTILHGSITLNGVSLTVSELPSADLCRIGIIPHTWARTNFHALNPGDSLNVEGDLIGKYVGRILAEGEDRRPDAFRFPDHSPDPD